MSKVALLLILIATCAFAQEQTVEQTTEKYPVNEFVMQLNDDNFQDAIDQFPLIMIKFYAPWCGHCKHLAPVYSQLGRSLSLSEDNFNIQVAEIDCTQHTVCQKHAIRGYPTLKYFIDGEAHQYSGARTEEALLEFLINKPLQVRNSKQAEQL